MSVLQNIYLFKELDKSELDSVYKIVGEKNYSAGQDIFLRGSKADALYIIKMGTVSIKATGSSGDEVKIANMATGAHFGELPFLDGEKRSASAQAVEGTTLFEIKYADLANLLKSNDKIAAKVYRAIAAYMAGRLRATTEDLNYAREHNFKHF